MQMVSEPDKLILESIAKVKGISIDDVKKDFKKNKKTKPRKSKRKILDPTVELISTDDARTVDFSQVKGKLRRSTARDNVFEWNIKDVAFYIRSKFSKRYDRDWGHRSVGACTELMRIHDRILDIYGHCDFLVMKDYVDYIFEGLIDRMVDKADGVFYLRNFRDDIYISSFSETYDYKESFERATWGHDEKKELKESISTACSSIKEVFLLSEESFVTTYGIVVCIFWLIKCQGYTNKDAAARVLDICKRIYKKGEFKLVRNRTELLSPYHESINFPRMEDFLKNIDGRYKIEIEYKENDIIKSKFKFLLEEQE